MKALKASIKSLKDQISILTETLKNSGSKENFDSLFQAIAKISASTTSQQLSIKRKKSSKMMDCVKFSFHNVYSNIFDIEFKYNCTKSRRPKRKKTRRFRRINLSSPPTAIHNISDYELSNDEKSLLERGLKFCPVPKTMNETTNSADTSHFIRKMRLKEFFHHEPSEMSSSEISASDYGLESQAISNLWTPEPRRNRKLDEFCLSITNYISVLPKNSKIDNISEGERKALTTLSKNVNKTIVIKPADKGGAIVIQNTTDYIQVCNALLSDPKFYREVEDDPTLQIKKKLTDLVKDLFKKHELPDNLSQKDFITRFPTAGRFYTLPKIHKPESPPPGRPIVSANGTATEAISAFADFHLKDLVPNLDSYIQDTTHFLQKLETIKSDHLPPHTLLITLDVTSLYTNIPHSEGLAASEFFLNQRDNQVIPTPFIIKLMEFVLKNNNFKFNNKNYIQEQGTAMGTKMAPSYACLFMGKLEVEFLASAEYSPHLWIRFIDDIFVIWTHGRGHWDSFFEKINNFHDSIKFVPTVSETSVPFLDVEVNFINGKIETDLYSKPTDSHSYLHWSSCHPLNTKKGIPYSQALRLRRICSQEVDFQKRLKELDSYLRLRGFPSKYIKLAFEKVRPLNRHETLVYKTSKTSNRITFPITYHPNLHNLNNTLHDKYNNILLLDPNNLSIFKEPPMLAYRRPPNLRNFLTRSTLPNCNATNETKGFHLCNNPKCDIHKYINVDPQFVSTSTQKSYPLHQKFDCNSHGVIYLITCKVAQCGKQYVGETGREFVERTREHIKDISHGRAKPVPSHFQEHFDHSEDSLANFSVQIIEHCIDHDTMVRRTRELFWINTLKPSINVKKL